MTVDWDRYQQCPVCGAELGKPCGHPETEKPLGDGRIFCKGCHEYLPAGAVSR